MHNITTKNTATVAPPAMLARSNITPRWAGKYDPSRSLYSHRGPMNPSAHSQLYSREGPIFTVKQVAPLKQYHAANSGGHWYVGKEILGRGVGGGGGRGLGVVRDEQASTMLNNDEANTKTKKFTQGGVFLC